MTESEAYQILGINPAPYSENEDIKKAYKKKVFETHPDRNGGNNEEFLKVQEAYNFLMSPKQQPSNGPFGFDFDMNAIFEAMNRQYGGGQGFKHSTMPPEQDRDIPVNIELNVEQIKTGFISRLEYHKSKSCEACKSVGGDEKIRCPECNGKGVKQEINMQGGMRWMCSSPCSKCGGIGFDIKNPCNICHGVGRVVYSEQIIVEIKEKK